MKQQPCPIRHEMAGQKVLRNNLNYHSRYKHPHQSQHLQYEHMPKATLVETLYTTIIITIITTIGLAITIITIIMRIYIAIAIIIVMAIRS